MQLRDGQVIICVTETKGHLKMLNEIAKRHNAKAIIHAGDFGFHDSTSYSRLSFKELRNCIQFGPLTYNERSRLLKLHDSALRKAAAEVRLSELESFLKGDEKLDIPVYTIWGNQEDVEVIKKFQNGSYHIPNLYLLTPDTSFTINVGEGNALRLFGIGGTHIYHRFFDIGKGNEAISGADGLMWTTLPQLGNLIQLGQRYKDPKETRVFVSHVSPGKEAIVNAMAMALEADFTVSGALHGRFNTIYTDFSIRAVDDFIEHLNSPKTELGRIWDHVRELVPMDQLREVDRKAIELVLQALAVSDDHRLEESMKHIWHLNLADVKQGHILLRVAENQLYVDSVCDTGIPINNTAIRRRSSAMAKAGSASDAASDFRKTKEIEKLKDVTEGVREVEKPKVEEKPAEEALPKKEAKVFNTKRATSAESKPTHPSESLTCDEAAEEAKKGPILGKQEPSPVPSQSSLGLPPQTGSASGFRLKLSDLPANASLEEVKRGLGLEYLNPTEAIQNPDSTVILTFASETAFKRALKVLSIAKLGGRFISVNTHVTEGDAPKDPVPLSPLSMEIKAFTLALGPVPNPDQLERIKAAYNFTHMKTQLVRLEGDRIIMDFGENQDEFNRVRRLLPSLVVPDIKLTVLEASGPGVISPSQPQGSIAEADLTASRRPLP